MRNSIVPIGGLVVCLSTSVPAGQGVGPSEPIGPTFDVVSIKKSREGLSSRITERPDGGFNATGYLVSLLIARAYAPALPVDFVGLPSWARSERYDVQTTSRLSKATPEERQAMLRAMLADRFKLVVHLEEQEQPVFDLVFARRDRALGPGIRRSEADCEAKAAERSAGNDETGAAVTPPPAPRVERTGPVPPCAVRINGSLVEGDVTMKALTSMFRRTAGRPIIDKTGLSGTYTIKMEFDQFGVNAARDTADTERAPSVFTAVQEWLGLKLEPSRAKREVLVIDRVQRPTENEIG